MQKRLWFLAIAALTVLICFTSVSPASDEGQHLTTIPNGTPGPSLSDDKFLPEIGVNALQDPSLFKVTGFVEGQSLAKTALLIEDSYPWSKNSNEQVLIEFGVSYDRIRSSSLNQADLSNYKFIMYSSSQSSTYYRNLEANLGKISKFVSDGGLLVAHCCDGGWGGADWRFNSILPGDVTHEMYRDSWSLLSQNIYIANPDHPIADGLSNSMLCDWTYSTHGAFTNIPAGAEVIMTTDNEKPTYIEYPYGKGKVLATMQTIEWGYGDWGSWNWYINAPELLRNEMRYALGGAGANKGIIESTVLNQRTFDPSEDHLDDDLSKCIIDIVLSKQAYVSIEVKGQSGKTVSLIGPREAAANQKESISWDGGNSLGSNRQIVPEGSYSLVIRARSGPSADSELLGEVWRWVNVKWHM